MQISVSKRVKGWYETLQTTCGPNDLFVWLFIATRAIFQLSGGYHHYRWQVCKFWPMLGAQGLWAGRNLYPTTPTATRDLGLYGPIRNTGTYVPQWDSNPRCKDRQIIAPDALTNAPRRRLRPKLSYLGKLNCCNDHKICVNLPVNETIETLVISTCLSVDCLE
jgi:hypothetical protein